MKTFLALYTAAPDTRPDMDEAARRKGMAAWSEWMSRNAASIVDAGGPLGRTKTASRDGVNDTRNAITAYVVVKADTHEAAAEMFRDHPHFTVFPGDGVEIMEQLPMPAM